MINTESQKHMSIIDAMRESITLTAQKDPLPHPVEYLEAVALQDVMEMRPNAWEIDTDGRSLAWEPQAVEGDVPCKK